MGIGAAAALLRRDRVVSVSVEDIAKQMLVLLPEDGTPVLNRVMRVMLARALSTAIAEDRYVAARQKLVDRGQAGVKGGQGGRIFLKTRSPAEQAKRQQASDGWTEARLMPCLGRYLDGPIQAELDILRGARCFACDTSSVGRTGVQWARPDFTLISVKQFKLLPGVEFDVHSFELKTESGGRHRSRRVRGAGANPIHQFRLSRLASSARLEIRAEAAPHREAMQPVWHRLHPCARAATMRRLGDPRRA
jgi:hypothetical protein